MPTHPSLSNDNCSCAVPCRHDSNAVELTEKITFGDDVAIHKVIAAYINYTHLRDLYYETRRDVERLETENKEWRHVVESLLGGFDSTETFERYKDYARTKLGITPPEKAAQGLPKPPAGGDMK